MDIFTDDVIMEILSWLPVKPLLRFRCVCKSWRSLIFHQYFVKLHLQRSPKIANILLGLERPPPKGGRCAMSCSISSLLENPLTDIAIPDSHILLKPGQWVTGSCNGLVCLLNYDSGYRFQKYSVRFWNPATRLTSQRSPHFYVDSPKVHESEFGFGYDKSSNAYKVVAVFDDKMVKAYTMGDHCWRDIQRFPAFPLIHDNDGRYLNNSLNWLAHRKPVPNDFIGQLVIVSLDLGKETYQQLLLPHGLDKDNRFPPTLGLIMDCLCLSHEYKKTHFVVWQMKEFGVDKSWTQFMKVSHQQLQIERYWDPQCFSVLPLRISHNGDALMLMADQNHGTILYNMKDNRVERSYQNKIWGRAMDFVQSLVLPW